MTNRIWYRVFALSILVLACTGLYAQQNSEITGTVQTIKARRSPAPRSDHRHRTQASSTIRIPMQQASTASPASTLAPTT